jgi:cyclopropane-fatty-acyl-phospholipid synthase
VSGGGKRFQVIAEDRSWRKASLCSRKPFVEGLGEQGGPHSRPQTWDIQVHNDAFYGRVLRQQSLGLGEAYMDGWWDCPRIDEFICRLLGARLDEKLRGALSLLPIYLSALLLNRQSRSRSPVVAERHYNLGNELFRPSSIPFCSTAAPISMGPAIWPRPRSKSLSSSAKLSLAAGEKLLDIGAAGGAAKYAAERYGSAVTP